MFLYPLILIVTTIVCYFLIVNKRHDTEKSIGFNQSNVEQITFRHSQTSRLIAKLFFLFSLVSIPFSIANTLEKQKNQNNPLNAKQLIVHNGIDSSELVNIVLKNESEDEVFVNTINLEGIQHIRGGPCYGPTPIYFKIGDKIFVTSLGKSGELEGSFKKDDNLNIISTRLRGNYVIDRCSGYKAVFMRLQTKIIIPAKEYSEIYLQIPSSIKMQKTEDRFRWRPMELVDDMLIDSLLFDSPLSFDSLSIEFITDQQETLTIKKIKM